MNFGKQQSNLVAGTILAITGIWLVLIISQALPMLNSYLSDKVPTGLVRTLVFGMPLFVAVGTIDLPLPAIVRLVAGILLIGGATFMPLSADSQPISTALVLLFVYVEAFLLMPKINSKLSHGSLH